MLSVQPWCRRGVTGTMGEPLQRIDTYDFAALYQRIEDGVVNGSAIAFAEEIVLAPLTDGRWLRSTELLSIW